jgi:hypothetical protein
METGIGHGGPDGIRGGLIPVDPTETQINTKQDLSAWVRAHDAVPGITWAVAAGPGGTMIIREFGQERSRYLALAGGRG